MPRMAEQPDTLSKRQYSINLECLKPWTEAGGEHAPRSNKTVFSTTFVNGVGTNQDKTTGLRTRGTESGKNMAHLCFRALFYGLNLFEVIQRYLTVFLEFATF